MLVAQKMWLEFFFFQTFSMDGWRGVGGREEGTWQQMSPSIIWEAVEGSAGPEGEGFLCKGFSSTRLSGNAAMDLVC